MALADYSHTSGYGTVASGSYQAVVGKFNNHGDTTDAAFIIGNGSSAGARNTLLKAAGSIVEVTGSLAVTGSLNITLQTGTPVSTVSPAGYYEATLNGSTVYIPYYV